MPALGTLPKVLNTGLRTYQNWHSTVEQPLREWLIVQNADPLRSTLAGYNGTTAGLQQLIGNAMERDLSIRAHGGTWSFSPVAATDGILLNTQHLNYRFPIDPGQVHPANAGGLPLLFVQCGMAVADLNQFLAQRGQAIRTCGASNGQTIAGAISTGTHGAALKIGAMQDSVRALHIITSPTTSVWLEPASRPAVRDEIAQFVGATLVRDDDLFHAALVGLGSFGIIHGVLTEVEPLFYLCLWRDTRTLDTPLWEAVRTLDFGPLGLGGGPSPDHFQIVLNPYDDGNRGLVTAMYRVAQLPAGSKRPEVSSGLGPGDTAFEAVGGLSELFPGATDLVAKLLDRVAGKPLANVCGEPRHIFRDTSTRGRAAGAGLGVPLDRTREVIELASEQIRRAHAPVVLAVRLVAPTKALLGFPRFAPATAVVDLDGAQSSGQRDVFRSVVVELERIGIPFTYHWGKLNEIDAARLRRMYPAATVDRWKAARRTMLPTAELRRTFANAFTDRADLSE
jgi:FAD/FMN-containing dehydrogenase